MILASDISVGEAGVYALLGYAVVFFGIVLLMIVITAFGKYFASKDAKLAATAASAAQAAAPVAPAAAPKAVAPAAAPKAVAPGSAGELALHDVEPKTAAMLMAIVDDKMGKPLNELRFISIKEVK